MARENRGPAFDLKPELFARGETFSFFQALRLLRLLIKLDHPEPRETDPIREFVRVRPFLGLAHPATELAAIEPLPGPEPAYQVTANFLGIYGESSPLPAFYTEDVINEPGDRDGVTRDFLDVINYPLYLLFNQVWTKHRLALKVEEEKDEKYLDILFSLLGLAVPGVRETIPHSMGLLRYIGLLTQQPKSAKGLQTLLADALHQPRLKITPCIKRKLKVPEPQRCLLGVQAHQLGKDSHLGEEIQDRSSKFRIEIGPVTADEFRKLLPGTPDHHRLVMLTRYYLLEPLECDLQINFEAGEARPARLGEEQWSQLGADTWIYSGQYQSPVEVRFDVN